MFVSRILPYTTYTTTSIMHTDFPTRGKTTATITTADHSERFSVRAVSEHFMQVQSEAVQEFKRPGNR